MVARARFSAMAIGLMMIVFGPRTAAAQGAPAADPTLRDVLLAQWSDIGGKVVKLAEEFPEDKYDYRPTPQVRTFADQLRHVAFWNMFVEKTARGEKIDGSINELAKAEYPTKATIVAALKKTLADATAELKKESAAPAPKRSRLWITFTEHTGEHYGQMVVYYRLNGIVPPASRSGG